MLKKDLDIVVGLHKQWLQSNGIQGRRAVLEGADLRQADLSNANLSYATLAGANLERAELVGATLCNADLRQVNLGYASLVSADLSGANLQQAVAMGVDLTSARLVGAILLGVRLDHALLRATNLTGVLARKVQFYRCDMTGAILDRADLSGANLSHANLTSASVVGTSFEDAELKGALFTAEQGQFLAAAQSLQNLSDDDLSVEEKQIISARRRFLRNVLFIQKSTFWIAIIGLVITILVGAFDLYAIAMGRTLHLAPDFNYIVALIVTLGAAFATTLAAFFRLRTLEGARTSRLQNQMNSRTVAALEFPPSELQNSETQTNETGK
ncbi:MAG: pentapeptide repeat-containing protein [Sterolibacterium sp.]|nr:pentapeptide repeat-containing protein [Sterolibacterium sp.]